MGSHRGSERMNIDLEQIEHAALNWKDIAIEILNKNIKGAVHLASEIITRDHNFKTMKDNEELWYYTNGYYIPIGEAVIKEIVQQQEPIHELINSHFISEIIKSVQRKTYIERKDFEAPLNLICVKNGVYNLHTNNLEPHNPNYYFKNLIPVNYVDGAICPKINHFIETTIEKKYQETAYEIPAFTLYRKYFIQKAIMLTGIGQNGKSVYLDLLTKLLGEDNLSHEQLQGICHSNFSSAELYGKLANICGDLPAVILSDTGNFKQMTSGIDSVSAQKKFQNPFNYINCAKLLFSANEIPETKDQTEAFFRRWLIIDFPYKFLSGLKEEEYTGFIKKENRELISELCTQEELEGFLFKVIGVLRNLLQRKIFTNSSTTEEIKLKYNLKSNSAMFFIESFIDDEIITEDGVSVDYVEKEFLYKDYKEFCEFKGINFKSPEAFYKGIKDRWNPNTEKKTVGVGVRKNVYTGISYNSWKVKEGILT
jgi:P4 family phage/plasmid primase-like protien